MLKADDPLVLVHAKTFDRIAHSFEWLQSRERSKECGVLWHRLKVTTRLVWCHAACLPGDHCLLDWSALSIEDRTALLVALENMKDFSDEAGKL